MHDEDEIAERLQMDEGVKVSRVVTLLRPTCIFCEADSWGVEAWHFHVGDVRRRPVRVLGGKVHSTQTHLMAGRCWLKQDHDHRTIISTTFECVEIKW